MVVCLDTSLHNFHGTQVFQSDCKQRLDAFQQSVCLLAYSQNAGAFLFFYHVGDLVVVICMQSCRNVSQTLDFVYVYLPAVPD